MPTPLPIARGRRFECTMCGNCCARDGVVMMTKTEERRIARFLGLRVRAFRAAYGVVLDEDGQAMLEAKDGAGCPLLTADRRCAVHPVKPMQCRTWPFWSEMVEDERAWAAAKAFCPGLDAPAGRRYTRPEILKILEEDTGTTDPLAEHRTNV